ncbi:MAG TPA: hypothetical protein VK607_11200, partial [Kofleriaceae bacterium]|nr:hypothetical protein [Kofleriaceae bacterium]
PAAQHAGSGESEPLDPLIGEVGAKSKLGRPRLDRTSLSADDIKRGMAAVAGEAQRCYAGTQGQALLRLTVAPSGVVQAVTVTGAFAGTPVAGCVERAVRAARFPPWGGRPQSFGYSYLLSD